MAETLFTFQKTGKLPSINKHLYFDKNFTPGRQEDAHEFLCCLMEQMEKAYLSRPENSNLNKDSTPIRRIFGGYLGTSVSCGECGYRSSSFQDFQDLALDIHTAVTLEQAIDAYFGEERLQDYRCASCKNIVSATKEISLERAPNSLFVHLKRYTADGKKIHKRVNIPEVLHLSKHTTRNFKRINTTLQYRLVSIVNHAGQSTGCGHYTAVGLKKIDTQHRFTKNATLPAHIPNATQKNGYILFYELRSEVW